MAEISKDCPGLVGPDNISKRVWCWMFHGRTLISQLQVDTRACS